jgi:hypothetical protein
MLSVPLNKKLSGIPFPTIPRKKKLLGIPYSGNKIEANSMKSVPNQSAEEKTTQNSVS